MNRISVVTPAYNAGKFLAESITSILAQTVAPDELIVVDDGSTDNTLAVAQSFGDRVRVLSQPNGGISVARNSGVGVSTGTLIAFQDADDIAEPRRLAVQAAAFEADPGLDMVFTHIVQFHNGTSEPPQPGCLPGAMMVRRSSFDRVGPFTPDIKLAEFLEWYTRAREAGLKERMLPEILLRRRIHDDNIGVREAHLRGNYARILKASLDRRRSTATGVATS